MADAHVMATRFSVSIRKDATRFSVDIRRLDKQGVAAPCGNCRLFRWAGDALIWIKETASRDIPASWPDLGTWNFARDYQQEL